MSKKQRTSINNLSSIGHELSEQHLSLASGGMRAKDPKDDGVPFGR